MSATKDGKSRLAAALRRNLSKRKAQQRERSELPIGGDPAEAPPTTGQGTVEDGPAIANTADDREASVSGSAGEDGHPEDETAVARERGPETARKKR